MIRVEFSTGDAAVYNDPAEQARILRNAADRIEQGAMTGSLYDANGNKVGHFKVT